MDPDQDILLRNGWSGSVIFATQFTNYIKSSECYDCLEYPVYLMNFALKEDKTMLQT